MTSDRDVTDVDPRLRRLGELSAADRRWPPLVDMSQQAVTSRLEECAAVSDLAAALVRAGKEHQTVRSPRR